MFIAESHGQTAGVGKQDSKKRRGAIVVLVALLLVFFLALVAFAVDLGLMYSAHTEM